MLIIMTMVNIKCPKCGYEWECKSKLIYVSCPSCRFNIKIKKEEDSDA